MFEELFSKLCRSIHDLPNVMATKAVEHWQFERTRNFKFKHFIR